jgi:hypothetical protein
MPDAWESTYGLSSSVNDASADSDSDGVSTTTNTARTNPISAADNAPVANAGTDQTVIRSGSCSTVPPRTTPPVTA